MFVAGRRFVSSSAERSKFRFYDLIKQSNRHPNHDSLPVSLIEKISDDAAKEVEIPKGEDAAEIRRKAAEAKIAKVFGGRIRGEDRQSSSRMNIGEPRVIAGVKVPDKPQEPDNCCMGGCSSCVWEIFDDDVKDWNEQRKKAASNLRKKGGIWPGDFHPPVELLKSENLPPSLASNASKASPKEKLEQEPWDNVPVQIRVFAEMEKRIKAKHKNSAST